MHEFESFDLGTISCLDAFYTEVCHTILSISLCYRASVSRFDGEEDRQIPSKAFSPLPLKQASHSLGAKPSIRTLYFAP